MMSELSDSTGVYIAPGTDEKFYLQCLSDDIIKNQCEPFLARAVVAAPGFPDLAEGSFTEGWCVARKDGYWLVYHRGMTFFTVSGEVMLMISVLMVFAGRLYIAGLPRQEFIFNDMSLAVDPTDLSRFSSMLWHG
ncbi:MAG TPA: hypothetical protein DCX91_12345 [Stenotrophomonas sp.]|nr:hypothetical protein [Stenotrophomonas sp.]